MKLVEGKRTQKIPTISPISSRTEHGPLTHLVKLHLHQSLQRPPLQSQDLIRLPLINPHLAQPRIATQELCSPAQYTLREVGAWNVELRIVLVFPDMLCTGGRVEDVFPVEERADAAVCWLLLVRAIGEEGFCEVFETWGGLWI